ncbi:hypothetical protein N234_27085 [Ralstonia pickettii DTP0602]|nr:hypothetical protein N234_27085 [Ralstonia pickettii DTP0602]
MRTDQSYTDSSDVLVLAVSLELAAETWMVSGPPGTELERVWRPQPYMN